MSTAAPPNPDLAPTPSTGRRLFNLWETTGMLLVFAVLFVGCSLLVPNFFSWVNFKGLLLSVATVGIIACTMLFCLAAGDFDLSVGSVVAMSGVLAATVTNATGNALLGVAAGVAAGGLVGLFNGFIIAQLGINALITTLASMQIVRGISFIICDGKSVGIGNDAFLAIGLSSFLAVPTPLWVMIACFALFGILLNNTTFGRNALAIGGNKDAAYLAGIAVSRTKILIFTLQGIIAAFAGIILASRMTSGQANTAQGLELQVISACVLGGVSLTGGVGTMLGVIVGVLIMGTVQNAMNLKNIPPYWQWVVSGAILLAAVLIDRLKQKAAR